MIQNYVNKLMENLPDKITKRAAPIEIDLMMSSGALNGSYLLGSLYFLREMENRKHIVIRRISGCSISSLLSLLYLTDNLDKTKELHDELTSEFKRKGNFSYLFRLKDRLKEILKDKPVSLLNRRLYISYHSVVTGRKHVVSKFTNMDEVIELIIRSSFVPFMIDYNASYKDKYIDGLSPHIFKKKNNRKRLYLDVLTIDKVFYTVNMTNEKNNYHRLFEGMLDIHKFFIKGCNTIICSDLDTFNPRRTLYGVSYYVAEKLILYFTIIFCVLTKIFRREYKFIKPVVGEILRFVIVNVCF